MNFSAKRLHAFRSLLVDAHRALALDFGFELWDGSTIPADLAPDALRILFAERAVTALIRRPTLDTLIAVYADGAIDLKNGHFLDLAAKRPHGKPGRLLRRIGKLKALRTAALFWFGPRADLASHRGEEGGGDPASNKRNIAHHYDVSNAFYRLFLDGDMLYSCAYFQDWHDDIDRAQTDKLDMICRKLRLKPGDRFLDIGCGWGALICHAARHYGITAVGITLAEEQVIEAREKILRLGLQDRVTVVLQDYSQLTGTFDKIASIGMFEHVGLRNHPSYFQGVHRLLAPNGFYLHHAITRRAKKTDKKFRKGSREYNALVRYIFPGGELDHIGMSAQHLERYGFEVRDVENWREHYARTCRLWFHRLEARKDEAMAEIGPEKTRLWLLYIAGCALAFERGGAQIFQTLAVKRLRGPSLLPPTRADLYR